MAAPFLNALVDMGVDPAIAQIVNAQFAKVESQGWILQDFTIRLQEVSM